MDNRSAATFAGRHCQFRSLAALAGCLLATVAVETTAKPATAADLKVVSGPAMARVITDLMPRIEALTHRTLVIEIVPPSAMAARLNDGTAFDVAAVYEPDAISVLRNSPIVAGRLSCIGWTRLGLAAAAGSDLPRIEHVAELQQTLLRVRSIGYAAHDPSGSQFRAALNRLGLLEKVEPKLVDLGTEDPLVAVGRGAVELGVAYIGEISSATAVRSLGPLPWQVQQLTPIYAGVSRNTQEREAAQRLIAFLSSFEATLALTAHDLDTTPNE